MTEDEVVEILLSRYLKNELDKEETRFIESWINASEKNKAQFDRVRRIVAEQKVHLSESELQQARERMKTMLISRLIARKGQSKLVAAISSVLLIVTGSLALYYANHRPLTGAYSAGEDSFVAVKNGNGESSECILPDSTHVWLNSNSEVCYRLKENGKVRSVEIKGEAFFDVAKMKKVPFEVLNGNIRLKVFGTRFNVKAFEEDVQVTLEEGSLGIYNGEQNEVTRLTPGVQAVVAQSGLLVSLDKVDLDAILGWKTGTFEFRDVSLDVIANKLTDLYGVKIRFDNEKLKNERFRCVINRNKSILQTMEILKQTSGLDYAITGSEIVLKSMN